MIIERHNFTRIKLTPSRLADFGSMIHRNQALVRYIWLCLELHEYDCSECTPEEMLGIDNEDNILITTTFENLFTTLSAWKPNGSLLLDISVHSPSDSEHWFKYLTFEPDIAPDECDRHRSLKQSTCTLAKLNDYRHGWFGGRRMSAPDDLVIHKVFGEIMGEGPFDDEEEEKQWWEQLPIVSAVTGVLVRQQNRRRWKPRALASMFTLFPRLEEVHYEPWMEWNDSQQMCTDRRE